MLGQFVTLGALVALGQAKAIITNNCRKDVYIWSVPEKLDLASNLSLSPGKRYEEPWRSGTAINPGIAIKVSTEASGIYTGKSEINFQYDVDQWDTNKIWVDLATVRGNDFDSVTLNTCHGGFKGPNVHTHQCSSTDDVELVLCGSERTVPSEDVTPIRVISSCISYLAERDDKQPPRPCSGRVVGPKRLPMQPDDEEDKPLAERADTVPLKAVMRLEAAKHAAVQDLESPDIPLLRRDTAVAVAGTVSEKPAAARPFCSRLEEALPKARCNEADAEHNARLFYHDNCGQRTAQMFTDSLCQDVRQQMAKIYPEITKSATKRPFCSLFQKAWPEARCNEADAQHNARLFYQDNCGEKTAHMFPARECQAIRQQMAKIYPDIIKRDSHLTMCINRHYSKFIKFWGSKDTVKDVFNNRGVTQDLFWDRLWTSDGELCQKPNKTVRPIEEGGKRCVIPFCVKGGILGGDCSEVEGELEKLSKDAGKDINWTSDDDVCPEYRRTATVKREVNTTAVSEHDHRTICMYEAYEKLHKYWGDDVGHIKDILNERLPRYIFSDRHWTDNEEQCKRGNDTIPIPPWEEKQHPCVKPYCRRGYCSDVEKVLNKISAHAGKNVDWTTSDDECEKKGIGYTEPGNGTMAVRKRDHRTVCIKEAYQKLLRFPHWRTKQDVREFFKGLAGSYREFRDVSFTSDEETCNKPYSVPDVFRSDPYLACVRPYCEPGDCSDVGEALNQVSQHAGVNIDWLEDEEDGCSLKHDTAGKRETNSTAIVRNLNDVRKVCVIAANEKLGKYWSPEITEVRVKEIFPTVKWTEELDNCSPQAITESRTYHNKLIDKKQKAEKKCVQPYCTDKKNCKRVKKELNKLSKDVGMNWSWTDDKKHCADQVEKADYGTDGPEFSKCVMGEHAYNKLHAYWGLAFENTFTDAYPDVDWTDDDECDTVLDAPARTWVKENRVKGKREQRCVSPYCKPFDADCSDVEDQLEEISKNVGRNDDWTTDDDACPKGEEYPSKVDLTKPHVCIKDFCARLSLPANECLQTAKDAEASYIAQTERPIRIATDGIVCQESHLSTRSSVQRPPRPFYHPYHEICRSEFCDSLGDSTNWFVLVGCVEIGQLLLESLNHTKPMDVRFTNDCNPPSAYKNLIDHVPVERNATTHVATAALASYDQEICAKAICRFTGADDTVCRQAAQTAEEYILEHFGKYVKFRFDGPVCDGAKAQHVLQLPPLPKAERGPHKVCGRKICSRSQHIKQDCQKIEQGVQSFFKKAMQLEVEFANSSDVCAPIHARTSSSFTNPPYNYVPQICTKAYCEPYVPGIHCEQFERNFHYDFPLAAGAMRSEEICRAHPPLDRKPALGTPEASYVCVREFSGDQAQQHKWTNWISGYYSAAWGLSVRTTTLDDVCGPEAGH